MTIPARAHFCWIGPRLPWAYAFAVLSAAARGEMGEVVLHHTDSLEEGPPVGALAAEGRVRLARLDAGALLGATGSALALGDALVALYRRIESPVMRCDILRAALLYAEGGIYLDLDTITTASLRPLLAARQFVGTEFIVWPQRVRRSRSPVVWARHIGLDLMRKALCRVPGGWRMFRRLEHLYFQGVNNAVMGAEAGAPLLAAYLAAMTRVADADLCQAYALGPDLLQALVDGARWDDLTVHAPEVFYPLPPRISALWFRPDPGATLAEVLTPATRVAHWYASVHTRAKVALIDPGFVRANQSRQLYSALVAASLDRLPGAG